MGELVEEGHAGSLVQPFGDDDDRGGFEIVRQTSHEFARHEQRRESVKLALFAKHDHGRALASDSRMGKCHVGQRVEPDFEIARGRRAFVERKIGNDAKMRGHHLVPRRPAGPGAFGA